MRAIAVAAALAVLSPAARAEVKTQEIEYRQGDTPLQGFLAWDDGAKGKRPGVLVVHEWWGHNEHARMQAERLAKAGYVGFALDLYGKGKVATHPKDAQAFMEEAMKDPDVVAARFDAALEVLRQQPQVDPERIAAIGYCMGGGVVLGRARAGADLDAVVTFHAAMPQAGAPAEKGKVKVQRMLLNTGGSDPMVPKEKVAALQKEMQAAGVKTEVITYPKAKHGFTNPDAGKAGMDALAYDADADRKSWDAAMKTFRQVFGKK